MRWSLILLLAACTSSKDGTSTDADDPTDPPEPTDVVEECLLEGTGLALEAGGSEACNTCVQDVCACEEQAYEAQPGGATYGPWFQCAVAACESCFTPICDAERGDQPVGLWMGADCATCLSTSCCEPTKACVDDAVCWACLTGGADPDGADCAGNAPFQTLSTCQDGCSGC